MEELKELFCKEQKKQTSSLGLLWFFLRHPQSVKLLFIIIYLVFLVFFWLLWGGVLGASLGVRPRKEKERILYPLTSSILSYIRMITIIILVLIIILYPHHYLLMKMKWMYLTLYSINTWIGFFFFSFLEREEPEWWCLECQGRVCHKDIIALENGHLLPFKSHVYEWEVSVCETEKCRYLGLWFHFGPFEKCSYFSSLGFLRYR